MSKQQLLSDIINIHDNQIDHFKKDIEEHLALCVDKIKKSIIEFLNKQNIQSTPIKSYGYSNNDKLCFNMPYDYSVLKKLCPYAVDVITSEINKRESIKCDTDTIDDKKLFLQLTEQIEKIKELIDILMKKRNNMRVNIKERKELIECKPLFKKVYTNDNNDHNMSYDIRMSDIKEFQNELCRLRKIKEKYDILK